MEVWKDILNYEGLYQISNFGRVKSFKYKEPRIMKPTLAKRGYLYVGLYKGGKMKGFSVHRLVAQAFIPNPDNKPEVDHIDTNKLNNHVSNLRWATSSENKYYAAAAGLMNRKLTDEQVLYIRENPEGLTGRQLAKKFGVSPATIGLIQLGRKHKTAGGQIRVEHGGRKLNPDQRAEIRKLYATGQYSQRKLAKLFGIARNTISNIIHEK